MYAIRSYYDASYQKHRTLALCRPEIRDKKTEHKEREKEDERRKAARPVKEKYSWFMAGWHYDALTP